MQQLKEEISRLKWDYLKIRLYHDRIKYYDMVRNDYRYTLLVRSFEVQREELRNQLHVLKRKLYGQKDDGQLPYPDVELKKNKIENYCRSEVGKIDEMRMHQLYGKVIEAIDPVVNPGFKEKRQETNALALEAYVKRKLAIMGNLAQQYGNISYEEPDDYEHLLQRKNELIRELKLMQQRLENLKKSEAYRCKTLLSNPERLKKKQEELKLEVRKLQDEVAYYRERREENESHNQEQ